MWILLLPKCYKELIVGKVNLDSLKIYILNNGLQFILCEMYDKGFYTTNFYIIFQYKIGIIKRQRAGQDKDQVSGREGRYVGVCA